MITPKPRHRPIIESVITKSGVLVREDYYQHPKGVSNIYLLSPDSKVVWEAELPTPDDAFANPIRLEEESFRCCTWDGFDCEVSLSSGKIVGRKFTK